MCKRKTMLGILLLLVVLSLGILLYTHAKKARFEAEASQMASSGRTEQTQENPSWCTMPAEYVKISAEDAKRLMGEFEDFVLLDVRTAKEYAEKRIAGAVLIEDNELAARAATELPDKTAVIFVYCRSGRRSEGAAKSLVKLGYNHVFDFGGLADWPYETTSGTA